MEHSGLPPPLLPNGKAADQGGPQRAAHIKHTHRDDDMGAARVANRLAPQYDADEIHLIRVDRELLFGRPRTLEEAKERASEWIAAHRAPKSWLEGGATHVKKRGLPMMRIVGEFSASQAMGRRLGGCDADTIWDGLTVEWLTILSSRIRAHVPAEHASDLMLVVSRLFDRRWHFAHLRGLATELLAFAHDRSASWAWDTWISRRSYSMLEMVALTLRTLTLQLVHEGLLAQWEQVECPVTLGGFYASRKPTTWRSLHPCASAGKAPLLVRVHRHC